MRRITITLSLLVGIILLVVGSGASADTVLPNELQSSITETIARIDTIGASVDITASHSILDTVLAEIALSQDDIRTLEDEGTIDADLADNLINYTDFWTFMVLAYGDMIDAGTLKQEGYQALLSNESDRYSVAQEKFDSAKEIFDTAKDSVTRAKDILVTMDAALIEKALPDAVVPDTAILDEMLYRLTDTVSLCQAYTDISKANLEKNITGDPDAPAVQELLTSGTSLMKELSESLYVGTEAKVFANITFS